MSHIWAPLFLSLAVGIYSFRNAQAQQANPVVFSSDKSDIPVRITNSEQADSLINRNHEGIATKNAAMYHALSHAYGLKKDFVRSAHYLKESMRIHAQSLNWTRLYRQYITLTELLVAQGQYVQAKRLYSKLYPLAGNNQLLKSRLNYTVGRACYELGEYDSAALLLYKTVNHTLVPDREHYPYLINAYIGLWNIATILDMQDKATLYHEVARLISARFRDTMRITALNHWGKLYFRKQDYNQAAFFTRQALEASRSIGSNGMRFSNAHTMAAILLRSGKANEALPYSKEAYETAGTVAAWIDADNIMGYNLVQLQRYKEAEIHLLRAFRLSGQQQVNSNLDNTCGQLSDAYAGMGDYQKALYYSNRSRQLTDSMREKENTGRTHLAQLELRYKAAERDKMLMEQQLVIKEKESRLREKNIWIGSISAGSLLLFFFLAGRFRNRQILQAKQKQIEHLNARMQGEELERGRIATELHDGVSIMLSAMKMHYTSLGKEFTDIKASESYNEILGLLNETSYELRSITYNLVPELLINESLPAAIQAFCELVRKGHHTTIAFQSYGDHEKLPSYMTHQVYRIIQELIQNILKHAHGNRTVVLLLIHEDSLHLTVEDDGTGFDAEHATEGMGLKNIRSRVESMQGQYAVSSHAGKGTTTEIEIPLPNA